MTTVNAHETSKSVEVIDFKRAIKSLSNPENLPSAEELRNRQSLD